MATGKIFYWLKLRKDFMTGDIVDFLMSQQDGANYVVLYQLLCLNCLNTNGTMATQIGDVLIEYDVEKIVRDCKYFSKDTVIVALELFIKLGLILKQENGVMQIADFDNMIGSESDYAKQKREQRLQNKKQKMLVEKSNLLDTNKDTFTDTIVDTCVDNVHQKTFSGQSDDNIVDKTMDNVHISNENEDISIDKTMDNVHTEIEREIEIRDRDKSKDKEREIFDSLSLKKSFDIFWDKYPKQKDYALSFQLYCDLVKIYTVDDILKATINYINVVADDNFNPRYIMNPATFLTKDNIKIYLQDSADTGKSKKNKSQILKNQNNYNFEELEEQLLNSAN